MDELDELDHFYNDFFQPRLISSSVEEDPITICDIADPLLDGLNQVSLAEGGAECDDDEQHVQSDNEDLYSCENELRNQLKVGCGCLNSCLSVIDNVDVQIHVDNIREMEKDVKDMYIMGALNKLGKDHKRSRYGERKRTRYEYRFEGYAVCRKAFLIIYDISEKVLKNLIKHLNDHGNTPRVHGNKGKKPRHALTFPDVERAVSFIIQFGNENGIPQPAAPRGSDGTAPIFVPASWTKRSVHAVYEKSCRETDARIIKYSAFLGIWSQCCSHIKIATPRDDVCARCEILRNRVQDARTDDDKIQASTEFQEHVLAAKKEHQVYRSCIIESRNEFRDILPPEVPVEPCTSDFDHAHYTFDFSNNVTLPHHARQMGPMYFVTPRKVHIFGFRDDGLPRQYNYLIDESETMEIDGKGIHGSEAVISMIDHALTKFSHGEKKVTFHADNCGGQNKNRYVLANMCWRTMVGLNTEVHYLMQLPGHARCLVDAGFAHIKKLYRRSDCETFKDFERVVCLSSSSNTAVTFTGQHGWSWREWKPFLAEHFNGVKGIRSYQQFRFSSADPGCVIAKKCADGEEVRLQLSKYEDVPSDRPSPVLPAGLSAERKRYLVSHVRQYLREHNKELTCPLTEE